MHGNTGERLLRFAVASTSNLKKWINVIEFCSVEMLSMLIYVETTKKNADELWKPTHMPALFQIMAWRWPGDKPWSEPIMVTLPTHLCVSRLQRFKIKQVAVWIQHLLVKYFTYQTAKIWNHISLFIFENTRNCWHIKNASRNGCLVQFVIANLERCVMLRWGFYFFRQSTLV